MNQVPFQGSSVMAVLTALAVKTAYLLPKDRMAMPNGAANVESWFVPHLTVKVAIGFETALRLKSAEYYSEVRAPVFLRMRLLIGDLVLRGELAACLFTNEVEFLALPLNGR